MKAEDYIGFPGARTRFKTGDEIRTPTGKYAVVVAPDGDGGYDCKYLHNSEPVSLMPMYMRLVNTAEEVKKLEQLKKAA